MRISDWSSDVCSSDLSKYAQPRCREHCADVVLQLESFISQLRIARAEDGIRDEVTLRVILFELGLDRSVTVILRTVGLWRPTAASSMTDIRALCSHADSSFGMPAIRDSLPKPCRSGSSALSATTAGQQPLDRKSTRLNSSDSCASSMPTPS